MEECVVAGVVERGQVVAEIWRPRQGPRDTSHEIGAVKGHGYDLDDGWAHTEVGLRFSLVVKAAV